MTNQYPTDWTTDKPEGIYGAEAKTYESALFDADGNQVGTTANGILHRQGYDWGKVFGLHVRYRQVKAWRKPAPKKPEGKEFRTVRTETYDAEGNLSDLTVEGRIVYANSKGEFIKTRSEGNPRITYVMDDGTRVIRKETRKHRVRNFDGKIVERWKIHVVTADEWEN